VYKITAGCPAQEKYGLVSQIRRSSVSVPSNIAEGHGRKSNKSFVNFLKISLGSLSELETQLIISVVLGFISENVLGEKIKEIRKMLYSLMSKLSED
jgi:four helix bundle protein